MSRIQSTGLAPDVEDTDLWGNVPLMSVIEEAEDESGAEAEEAEALIEPSDREIVDDGEDDEDDDDDAYEAMVSADGGGLSPGEAEALVAYMKPLSEEEEELNNDPMFRDLRWIDDPAHTEDVLAKTKGTRALSDFMRDASYGDDMKDEERSERCDSDRTGSWMPTSLSRITNQSLFPVPARYELIQRPKLPSRLPTGSNQALVDAVTAKFTVVSGLNYSLVTEHAAWLEEQDRKSKIAIRPKSYYLNVARLWAKDQITKAALPTSRKGNFSASHGDFVGAAVAVLEKTEGLRKSDDTLGGWNPLKTIKSVATSAYKGVKKATVAPLKYGYKYGKKGLATTYKYGKRATLDPLKYGLKYGKKGLAASYKYGKKAVMLPLTLAQKAALAPLRKIVRQYTGKMVNNKAMALARQKGLSAPGPAERLAATNLTKNFIKSKTGYGAAIVSLMGADDDLYNIDMSYGDARADVMGLGKSGLAGLILLGPIGLIAVLTGLVKTGGAAAATDPNAEGYSEEGYPEEGAEEGAPEEGAYEEGAYEEGSPEEGGYDASADYGDYSEGWAVPRKLRGLRNRKRITVESLARMNPLRRAKVQQAIRSGRLRLG